MSSSSIWKSSNSTTEELKAAKLGLAALMFVYVCIACYLPIFVFHLLNKYSKTSNESANPNSDQILETNHDPNGNQPNSRNRFSCMKWSPETRQKLVSRANCLAAGAFLSVGFLDVFMDTMESVDDAMEALNIKTQLPIASLLTLAGFFLVLGVEQISMALYEIRNHKHHHPEGHSHPDEQRDIPGVLIRRISSCSSSSKNYPPGLTGMSEHLTIFPNSKDCVSIASEENTQEELVHDHGAHLTMLITDIGWVQAMTLLGALSLHSIFEGLALGLCDSVTSLLTLFGALSMHKLLIAISIGINLATEMSDSSATENRKFWQQLKSKTQILRLLAVLLFAGASPLGALIGWAVSLQHNNLGFLVAEAILQGLACGTFFYVVFCELLPKEFKETKTDKIGKFIFLLIGFGIIALVICLLPAE